MASSIPSIGIDLGTTNSALATASGGPARIIERASGQRLLPSMVGLTSEGIRLVGEAARQYSASFPEQVASATKRFIGQRFTPELAASARRSYPFPLVSGPAGEVRVRLGERSLSVVELGSILLASLRADAEAYFGQEVRKAVLTVPAAFTDAQRQATREAAALAGLEVLRLVNEPTAAAMAYGISSGFKGNVVVFDLGGGTFDVSILSVRDGVFEVVATGGDPAFGGEDFDNVLVQWLESHLTEPSMRERIAHDRRAVHKLKMAAEQAKKAISTTEKAHILAELMPATGAMPGITIETLLTRDFFEKLVRPKTEYCLSIVERTMEEAKLTPADLGAVLLVGGMTRVPLLRQLVLERFGKLPDATVNPDEVVALGAAMHAAELVDKHGETLLLDVVGSSLGLGIAGGLVKPLIRKNSMLPCSVRETFYPARDAQTVVRMPVVQGEARLVEENDVLGELTLDGLEATLRSDAAIEVTFAMDQEGILSVSAIDVRSGKTEAVRVGARAVSLPREAERLAATDQAARDEAAAVAAGERNQNRHARRTLRQVLAELHRLHQEILQAEAEHPEEDKEIGERLGGRIVEAEQVEREGTPEEVLALAASLVALLEQVTSARGATATEG